MDIGDEVAASVDTAVEVWESVDTDEVDKVTAVVVVDEDLEADWHPEKNSNYPCSTMAHGSTTAICELELFILY